MKILNKFIIKKSNGEEETLELNKLYEFRVDNFKLKVGRLTTITDRLITFDCSQLHEANVINYELHRITHIEKLN